MKVATEPEKRAGVQGPEAGAEDEAPRPERQRLCFSNSELERIFIISNFSFDCFLTFQNNLLKISKVFVTKSQEI